MEGHWLGAVLGLAVGITVGTAVGLKRTADTPAPATAAWPVHAALARQPSRIRYVCDAVPAGTVYVT